MREDLRRSYDRSAAEYDGRFRALQAPKYDAVLAHFNPTASARVVDLGGGTGLLLERLGPLAHPAVVLDLSRAMLARCTSAASRVQGDLVALPLADGRFDVAFSITSLLVPTRLRCTALLEVARVLAPGGVLCLTVLAEEADRGLEMDLRASGFMPGPRFECGQDVGLVCALGGGAR